MKKIIISLSIIAATAAVAAGVSIAFFSDSEISSGNTFTAGTIDISVDGENPWDYSWQNELDKPCQTNYMLFTVKNSGNNPAKVWKRLANITTSGGEATYCGASSEPEYVEGGGQFTDGICNSTGYTERKNLPAFMVYDMAVCVKDGVGTCETVQVGDTTMQKPVVDTGWQVLIDENAQVRVDNIADTWIELTQLIDELDVNEELVVSQSYHLMTWDNSGQPMVTNWAQGDVMTFDVELEARQTDAPAPGTTQNGVVKATAVLVQKDTTTWEPVMGGAEGSLTYEVEGATFKYDFSASNLVDGEYRLVYYPDPWTSPKTVTLIGSAMTTLDGSISVSGQSVDLGMDLPNSSDANYPVGAKVWLVPTSSLSGDQLSWTNLNQFLFDKTLVKYEDTDN